MHARRTPFRLATALLLAASVAHAQDLLPKAAPQDHPIVLEHATIHTVASGVVLDGTLWFADGVIRQVLPRGERPTLPSDGPKPQYIDLAGKHVFPGMISAHTSLGLIEIGQVPQSVDTNELGELTPEARALTAVNPDSAAIPVARRNGVLAAAVFPSGGLLPGRTALIQLDGWTNEELALRQDAGPVVAWPRRSNPRWRRFRGGDAKDEAARIHRERRRIADTFMAARAWLDARTADASVALDIRHEALVPALRGEVPVFVLANDSEAIESAIRWGIGAKLRLVIVGGHEARACRELLVQHQIPVVIDGVHRLPSRDDAPFDEPFTLPRDLASAGVRFCIATGEDFSFDRNLPYHAATAATFGLDRQQALAAITLHAAQILGVDDRLGSLEPGKHATLFVADGHPFELASRIEHAFVHGRRIDLRSKQTELARKYRERYRQLQDR